LKYFELLPKKFTTIASKGFFKLEMIK